MQEHLDLITLSMSKRRAPVGFKLLSFTKSMTDADRPVSIHKIFLGQTRHENFDIEQFIMCLPARSEEYMVN